MKQRDLIKKLEAGGFVFDHLESSHDIYKRGENQFETVERHKEIPKISTGGFILVLYFRRGN